MILKIIFILLLYMNIAQAGTGTGCSGDQWSTPGEENIKEQWVYHTNRTWEIGFSGYGTSGCDKSVSVKNNSKSKVFMKNGTCTYKFNGQTEKLTIGNSANAKCGCKGTYILKKTCSEGE